MTAMTYDTPLRPRSRSARPVLDDPACYAPRAAEQAAVREAAPGLRLTRRGRALLLLALVGLLLVAFSLGRTSADAGSAARVPRQTTVVQPGETLWSIARRVAPGADPRATVERLTRLNDLGSRPIVPGQRLELPR